MTEDRVLQPSRRSMLAANPGFLSLLAVHPADVAGTFVKVALRDKGKVSMDAMDMEPMGMA
jgi:hypothetical protein